jgi:hypothetical protein
VSVAKFADARVKTIDFEPNNDNVWPETFPAALQNQSGLFIGSSPMETTS